MVTLVLSRSDFVKIDEIKDEAPKYISFQNLASHYACSFSVL